MSGQQWACGPFPLVSRVEEGSSRWRRWSTVSTVSVLVLHVVFRTLFGFRCAMNYSSVPFNNNKKKKIWFGSIKTHTHKIFLPWGVFKVNAVHQNIYGMNTVPWLAGFLFPLTFPSVLKGNAVQIQLLDLNRRPTVHVKQDSSISFL